MNESAHCLECGCPEFRGGLCVGCWDKLHGYICTSCGVGTYPHHGVECRKCSGPEAGGATAFYCPNCGQEGRPDDMCVGCGANLPPAEPVVNPHRCGPVPCPGCEYCCHGQA